MIKTPYMTGDDTDSPRIVGVFPVDSIVTVTDARYPDMINKTFKIIKSTGPTGGAAGGGAVLVESDHGSRDGDGDRVWISRYVMVTYADTYRASTYGG